MVLSIKRACVRMYFEPGCDVVKGFERVLRPRVLVPDSVAMEFGVGGVYERAELGDRDSEWGLN